MSDHCTRECANFHCPSGSRNDKAIGTNEAERAKRSCFMQDIRGKLGDSLRVASGQIDTSLDPIEEETVVELYQIWLEDYEIYAGNSAQARRFAAISQR